MPWELIKLNSGYHNNHIPSIGLGTWTLDNSQGPIDQDEQAPDNAHGYNHIGTVQAYRNEEEKGVALKETGLSRSDVFVMTKCSSINSLDIPTSIKNSLNSPGVLDVDLYLVHSPCLAVPNIPTYWAQMEKAMGLFDNLTCDHKSIGISNIEVQHMETLMASAQIKPARQKSILEYATKN
ncbi:NADP-dependent oxidoreductase domain-containing protein [Suillus placidus]|uniref:NADP-dependent oxidoreductase domain-containing protein n=1 Tax=Suillus placidus TaxID=48579 RepID=A0A9P6ZN03_9AGAM|nr:NADP-dependent oxidoreductase domain-containing protein [Suillus placidus]